MRPTVTPAVTPAVGSASGQRLAWAARWSGLLRHCAWPALRQHPWRSATAVLAVTLGVALALSVQLINASALSEFAGAVRALNGQPDLELRAVQGGFDEALYARAAARPEVALASPVLEAQTLLHTGQGAPQPLRVLGVDALLVAELAPALLPRLAEPTQAPPDPGPALTPGITPAPAHARDGPDASAPPGTTPPSPRPEAPAAATPLAGSDRLGLFAPDALFLNAAARALPGVAGHAAASAAAPTGLRLQSGAQLHMVRVAGTVGASGPPLAVMDIGAAQELLGRVGQLSRIDLRLRPGSDEAALLRALALPPGVTVAHPGDATERASQLSRAYRANLTVLALVALFTGGFLVFSVLALSVAQRAPQFALLGVLGLTAAERRGLVLAESALLGVLGSALGVALGTALAALALRLLGGDLGGGYFPGSGDAPPPLQWHTGSALGHAALGLAAALAGGWWPARTAERLPLAQTLKGLGSAPVPGPAPRGSAPHTPSAPSAPPSGARHRAWAAWATWRPGLGHRLHTHLGAWLCLAAVGLALLPPVGGLPLAAYAAVALLLVGGVLALPQGVGWLCDRLAPRLQQRLLPLLAVERARRVRHSAAVAVSGVVAALSLSVALTVMVGSFRDSVARWLDAVLPAALYVRASAVGGQDAVFFEPAFAEAVAALPGVARVGTLRQQSLLLDPAQPPVVLIARALDDPLQALPLVAGPLPVPPGQVGVYVSEAMRDLHGARLGQPFPPLHQAYPAPALAGAGQAATFFVAGVWRDYARQTGSVVLAQADHVRLGGDRRINDLALWLAPGADAAALQPAIRALAGPLGEGLAFASAAQVRANSLRVFDRSFAVTHWLQVVAIGIGLFGVAASFSAQVLARRKEFGLLAHLGFTRRQVLAVVAAEGAVWTALGALAGLALGLAVAVVLVHVVNPQSFHWTMELSLPWVRLAALCLAVVAAGTLTAHLAGRAAASRDAVLAVKEDW